MAMEGLGSEQREAWNPAHAQMRMVGLVGKSGFHRSEWTRICYRCRDATTSRLRVQMMRRLDWPLWECPECGWLSSVTGAHAPADPKLLEGWRVVIRELMAQHRAYEKKRKAWVARFYMFGSYIWGRR